MRICKKKNHFTHSVFIISVSNAVKITNLKVPSVYILSNNENPEPLILDCEYDVSLRENGFVLKWLFNDHQIYQWIPSNHQPHSLVSRLFVLVQPLLLMVNLNLMEMFSVKNFVDRCYFSNCARNFYV